MVLISGSIVVSIAHPVRRLTGYAASEPNQLATQRAAFGALGGVPVAPNPRPSKGIFSSQFSHAIVISPVIHNPNFGLAKTLVNNQLPQAFVLSLVTRHQNLGPSKEVIQGQPTPAVARP